MGPYDALATTWSKVCPVYRHGPTQWKFFRPAVKSVKVQGILCLVGNPAIGPWTLFFNATQIGGMSSGQRQPMLPTHWSRRSQPRCCSFGWPCSPPSTVLGTRHWIAADCSSAPTGAARPALLSLGRRIRRHEEGFSAPHTTQKQEGNCSAQVFDRDWAKFSYQWYHRRVGLGPRHCTGCFHWSCPSRWRHHRQPCYSPGGTD